MSTEPHEDAVESSASVERAGLSSNDLQTTYVVLVWASLVLFQSPFLGVGILLAIASFPFLVAMTQLEEIASKVEKRRGRLCFYFAVLAFWAVAFVGALFLGRMIPRQGYYGEDNLDPPETAPESIDRARSFLLLAFIAMPGVLALGFGWFLPDYRRAYPDTTLSRKVVLVAVPVIAVLVCGLRFLYYFATTDYIHPDAVWDIGLNFLPAVLVYQVIATALYAHHGIQNPVPNYLAWLDRAAGVMTAFLTTYAPRSCAYLYLRPMNLNSDTTTVPGIFLVLPMALMLRPTAFGMTTSGSDPAQHVTQFVPVLLVCIGVTIVSFLLTRDSLTDDRYADNRCTYYAEEN